MACECTFTQICEECAHSAIRPTGNPKLSTALGKVPMDLVPPILIGEAALAYLDGLKHGRFNWRGAPVVASAYAGAILRHLGCWMDGEDRDPMGPHHLGSIAATCGIILDAASTSTLVDDRVKSGFAAWARAHEATAQSIRERSSK